MKNINHLIDMTGQSHYHLPLILTFIIGLIVVRSRPIISNMDDRVLGDNFPVTLMEAMGR